MLKNLETLCVFWRFSEGCLKNVIRVSRKHLICVLKTSTGYCRTRLHLGYSAKLKIWQVPVCKMEPRSAYKMHLGPPTHPPPLPHQSEIPLGGSAMLKIRFFQCCAVSPPSSIYFLPPQFCPPIKKVCAVSPLSIDIFPVHCPSPSISVSLPHSALSWILSVVSN